MSRNLQLYTTRPLYPPSQTMLDSLRRLVHQQHVESYQQQSAAPVRAEKQQSAAPVRAVKQQSAAPVRAEKQQSAAPVRAEKQPTPEPIFNFLQLF